MSSNKPNVVKTYRYLQYAPTIPVLGLDSSACYKLVFYCIVLYQLSGSQRNMANMANWTHNTANFNIRTCQT